MFPFLIGFILETFTKMRSAGDVYYVTVIEDTSKQAVIGAATLVVEQKFIHNCAKVRTLEIINSKFINENYDKNILFFSVLESRTWLWVIVIVENS